MPYATQKLKLQHNDSDQKNGFRVLEPQLAQTMNMQSLLKMIQVPEIVKSFSPKSEKSRNQRKLTNQQVKDEESNSKTYEEQLDYDENTPKISKFTLLLFVFRPENFN